MTDETQLHIERGHRAEMLLKQECYQEVMGNLVQSAAEVFFATDVAEAEKREQAFFYKRGLTDIDATLKHWVGIKDQILNESQREE